MSEPSEKNVEAMIEKAAKAKISEDAVRYAQSGLQRGKRIVCTCGLSEPAKVIRSGGT